MNQGSTREDSSNENFEQDHENLDTIDEKQEKKNENGDDCNGYYHKFRPGVRKQDKFASIAKKKMCRTQ